VGSFRFGISQMQGYTGQHENRNEIRDRQTCLEWDWNPGSQCLSWRIHLVTESACSGTWQLSQSARTGSVQASSSGNITVPGVPFPSISLDNASLAKITIRKLNSRTPRRKICLQNTLILLLFFTASFCIPQSVQTQREAFCGYSQASSFQSFFVKH
jgi:hypothetical protein